jgi:hypothetical protein
VELRALQTKLLGLITSTYRSTEDDDPYLGRIDGSEHLALVREIASWWQAVAIESHCRLTTALLRRRGIMDEVIDRFTFRADVSPFHRQQVGIFLDELSRHPDPVIASVAAFERALLSVTVFRSEEEVTVAWDRDPYVVLSALMWDRPLEEPVEARGLRYRTVVRADLPGSFRVEISAL